MITQDKLCIYNGMENYSARYGRCFTRHVVNTWRASPAALRIQYSVCPDAAHTCFAWVPAQYFPVLSVQIFAFYPAHTSVYGRSQPL